MRALLRQVAVLGLLTLLVVGGATPVAAHVDLIESVPSDQARLSNPPADLELVFSGSVTPAGDGIELVDEAGTPLEAAVSQPAADRFEVVPTVPLGSGAYGVVWTVRAGDAHPRTGSFVFSVAATQRSSGGAAESPRFADSVTGATEGAAAPLAIPAASPTEPPGKWVTRIGHWIAMSGVLVAVGALVFAGLVLVGSRREVREAVFWVRRAGIATLVGALLEVAGVSMATQGSVLSGLLPWALMATLASSLGVPALLRLAGGVAMLFGAQIVARPIAVEHDSALPALDRGRPAGGAATMTQARTAIVPYRLDVAQSRLALLGAAIAIISYLFDGHTVTASPGLIVRLADLVHIVAAGVWVGGVLMLGWVLARRHRRGVPLRAADLTVRFSPIAALALSAVAVAGLALTWTILDTPGELVSTDWGRTLIAKLVVVAAAAAMGGYNHRYVVPRLAADPNDEEAGHMLRRVVRVEGMVLVAVVAVTAILVSAAS